VQGFQMLKKGSFFVFFWSNPNGEEKAPTARKSNKKNGSKMQNLTKPQNLNQIFWA
jgi:hypothetical protein